MKSVWGSPSRFETRLLGFLEFILFFFFFAMDTTLAAPLVGSEIHGFHTLADLDVPNMTEEAKTRWLRPNEIHAILCNHKCFSIHVKPVHLPTSGSVLLFDRKMLRNFRKDGHSWKKKNDGKTVKEAHEHLKVGNEERIHVYYAHGQANPTFVRRCYWLLDKSLEHIVLVHYRETQEGLPGTPVNSNSSSVSDQSTPWVVPEDLDSGAGLKRADSLSVRNHEKRLHEINTLEWDELLVTNDVNESSEPLGYNISVFNQQNQVPENGSLSHVNTPITYNLSAEMTPFANLSGDPAQSINSSEGVCNQTGSCQVDSNSHRQEFSATTNGDFLDVLVNELPNQESFGRWINSIMIDSPGSVDCHGQESSNSSNHDSFGSPTPDHELHPVPEHIFNITDISPVWTYSNEKTKILVTGFFCEDYQHLAKSNMLCVCGGISVPAEIVQPGVYRCFVSQQSPGLVNFYMSIDGNKPISQVVNFEYRAPSPEDQSKWEKFQLQLRLSYLLFSSSKSLNILSGKVSPHALNEAKKFACKTAKISNSWACLIKSIESGTANFSEAKNSLLEITFRIRLKEWLQERILEGCKTTERDSHGQGVIHLCAILGYTWAIRLFSWSGLSLDFRDKYGWTALHWAAYLGNEKMVAVLLSAGAKANMVTDPTPQNPGGCTASDLASMKGYAGLAAYLSEQALVSQFEDMVIAGNATGSLHRNAVDATNTGNLDEDQLCMKEYLAVYQTVADAAARIQAAFREHSLKVRTKAVLSCNPEDEARHIVAAMKIQHAFRIYETRKKMAAAARIQYRYRTWKMRRDFIKMRNQARKIQAAFRGFQVRRQYRKILWSVGVVEKAILRWRLKRKGLRGLHVKSAELVEDQMSGSETELDFYKISQKQSQERVERAVVTVQAMFRSKKARQEYQRMKLAHSEAALEYERLEKPDPSMDICSL